jgi:tetrapyrrole methylase family protein / MazG family protein
VTGGPGRITVVGLGPAGPELANTATIAAIDAIAVRFLRTSQHPSASLVAGAMVTEATTFDHLYETLPRFDDVYAAIVEALVVAARAEGHVLYAVPGSPSVAERTVELLLADGRVNVDVVPAMSFLDLTWTRLGVDPFAGGVRIVDAHRFALDVAGQRGPFLVAQCHSRAVLSDIKLAADVIVGDGRSVDMPIATVLHHLGLPDEVVIDVAWHEIDHFAEADHLTSLWIPWWPETAGSSITRLEQVMAQLRTTCPWDLEQTHESLAKYCIEEAHELAEAIRALSAVEENDSATDDDEQDAVDHLADELGDVLFQVIFHTCLGAEDGRFSMATVTNGLIEKLIRRHPHVFGDVVATTVEEVRANWVEIKAQERRDAEAARATRREGRGSSRP